VVLNRNMWEREWGDREEAGATVVKRKSLMERRATSQKTIIPQSWYFFCGMDHREPGGKKKRPDHRGGHAALDGLRRVGGSVFRGWCWGGLLDYPRQTMRVVGRVSQEKKGEPLEKPILSDGKGWGGGQVYVHCDQGHTG